MEETEEPIDPQDAIPPEYMPDEFERFLLSYQFIVHETPFQERLDNLYGLLEREEDEAADKEFDEFTDEVIADFRERAELARFDFMPEEQVDLMHIKHRLEVQAMIASIESADDDERRKREFDHLEEYARDIMDKVSADFEAGIEYADGWLIAREDHFIAHYFPELLDEIREEVRGG